MFSVYGLVSQIIWLDLYVGLFALMDYSDYLGIIISNYLVICWHFILIYKLILLLDASMKTLMSTKGKGQSTLIEHNSGATWFRG
jgi:hypothetical protein